MRILYVANHDQTNSADDEGAITHVLTQLGHNVQRIHERNGYKAYTVEADFLLFHKWSDMVSMKRVKCPKVFWYFDLVEWPNDRTLEPRNHQRRRWMQDIIPVVDIGFCTDGDWVAKDQSGKIVWLPQGADERVIGRGRMGQCPTCRRPGGVPPILMTGISKGGGQGRIEFVEMMMNHYGKDFIRIDRGVYGRELADLIASTQIVVAPDSPVTDSYWSNRVYTTLGMGGFLVHPTCRELVSQYQDNTDLVFYRNREQLHNIIGNYLQSSYLRGVISDSGLETTRLKHTYRHRCEQLISVVKERLGI